jgi:hypothetical protein
MRNVRSLYQRRPDATEQPGVGGQGPRAGGGAGLGGGAGG